MKLYRRRIIFTKCPLKEAFQYRDKFLIQPITRRTIPKCPYAKHFPVFLDYTIDLEDGELIIEKDIDETQKICALLTALSNFEFFTYSSDDLLWGVAAPSTDIKKMTDEELAIMNEKASTSSWICVAAFLYPEFKEDQSISSLTILDGNTVMPLDSSPFYFTDNPIEEKKERVSFQEKITEALDTYYALDSATRQNVYSAIRLITSGIKLGLHYKSLGFISYISSIETMVELEYKEIKPKHCKECGQLIFGVRKKFIAYLEKYVSKTYNAKKKFGDYYTLRSKIAHAGKLFLSDVEFSIMNLEVNEQDWFKYMDVQQLARLSLFRWLLLNNQRS